MREFIHHLGQNDSRIFLIQDSKKEFQSSQDDKLDLKKKIKKNKEKINKLFYGQKKQKELNTLKNSEEEKTKTFF